jgi:hypothetical protein
VPINKFAFPSDTRTTLATGLSTGRTVLAGMSDSGVAGYFGGGLSGGSGVTAIDKFAFPSDTRTTLATGLSSGRFSLAGTGDSGVAGYFAGGWTGAYSARTSTVDKFAFPSDTRSTLGTGLSSLSEGVAGFSNEGSF